jgi:DNA-binding NarL/FixJ family response regulator
MDVVIVGTPTERARLRANLPEGVHVVAEVATLAEARANNHGADAWLLAPARRITDGKGVTIESLTPREQQVLELLAEGLPNKIIASRLAISDQTAKFHVASICGKLGAANRTEAVRIALRRGLLTI